VPNARRGPREGPQMYVLLGGPRRRMVTGLGNRADKGLVTVESTLTNDGEHPNRNDTNEVSHVSDHQ